jgi:GH24 family phage-related lysozyme (muramidase)
MDQEKIIFLLSDHEGVKLKVYDDYTSKELKAGDVLVGHPTIGIGRNVAKDGLGISQEEAEFMLMNDISRVKEEIKNFPIEHLNEVRTAIIIDMAFNMGITRFNPTMWKKTFQAIVNEDWQKATTEMLDSNWARQTKRRSARLSQMMLVGNWID